MNVHVTISREYLYRQWDRLATFTPVDGGEFQPGQSAFQFWAGDGTEPTDWTDAEFAAEILAMAAEKGWEIASASDTRRQDVEQHNRLLAVLAAAGIEANGVGGN